MSDALELYRTRKDLPIPDDKVEVKANGRIIAYQGDIGKNVLETIEYTENGLDPKDKEYFSYYLTKNKKYFQLMAFLEEENDDVKEKAYLRSISKTFATDYSERKILLQGKKLGILTDTENKPIQKIEEVTNSGYLDIVTTNKEYKINLENTNQVTGTGIVLSNFTDNASCDRLKRFKGVKNNGIYKINPTGTDEYNVYCNMELGGGGWTLIATTADDGDNTWTYNNRDLLTNTTTTGSLSQKNKDFKSKAYSQIKFKDMMFEDRQGEWGAYDDIHPEYNQTVADWMPMTLACAFGTGRDYYMTSGSISINKGINGTQQDRGLFFTIYDNEGGCSTGGQSAYGPTWGYRNNGGLSPDDPGLMGWGPYVTSGKENSEGGYAKLGNKNHSFNETNTGDYIYWYVR